MFKHQGDQRTFRYNIRRVLLLGGIAFLLAYAIIPASCGKKPEEPLLTQAQINTLFAPADASLAKHDPRRAVALAYSACKIPKYQTDQIQMMRYSRYTRYYQVMGKRDSAVLFADSAIFIADRHSMTDTIWLRYSISRHFNKGAMLYYSGEVQPAIDEFFKAKDKAEKSGEECHFDNIYHLIGLALYQQQRYTAARTYFDHTLQLYDRCHPPGSRFNYDYSRQEMLNNIALCDENLGHYASARRYCEKALAQIGHSESIGAYSPEAAERCRGVVYGTIAQTLLHTAHTDSAEIFFKRSIGLTNSPTGDVGDAQLTQVYLGDLYLQQQRYPLLKNILENLGKSLKNHTNEEARLGWERLVYGYDSASNQRLQELAHYKHYVHLRDSIAEVKGEQRQTDLNEALNSRSQQLEISLLKKDNQLDKTYLWVVLALSLLALVIIALVLINYRRSRRHVKALTDLNDQIGRQKDALEEANRAKDQILHIVAHDLRNPVGAVAYLADSMLIADELKPWAARPLGQIRQSAQNALELINELLALPNEAGEIVKERVDLDLLLVEATELLRYKAAEKQQQLILYPAGQSLPVMSVPGSLTRLIGNLVMNAIKFSYPGTRIELRAAIVEGQAEFTVADQGIGIPEPLQATIFDTFTTARRPGTYGEKSYGLGLSVCKQIAMEHGGSITVKSKPGAGTAITVSLPLSDDI